MTALIITVFLASLLGSAHCVGMCGPFALIAGMSSPDDKRTSLWPTAAYNLGRLLTYIVVGIIFGGLGLAINHGTSLAGFQRGATFMAGMLMIVVGTIAMLRQFGWGIRLPGLTVPLHRALLKIFRTSARMRPIHRATLIGMMTTLMPCGWLYAFAITAAGTGSPFAGAATMAVFWLGTLPLLAAFAAGVHRLSDSFRARVPLVMASLIVVVGLFTLFFRAPITVGQDSYVVDGIDQSVEQVQQVDQHELPCCRPQD